MNSTLSSSVHFGMNLQGLAATQWRGNDFSTGWSRPTFSSSGSGGRCKAPAGSGAEPRRQADFDNNLLKINRKSGLWVDGSIGSADRSCDIQGLLISMIDS